MPGIDDGIARAARARQASSSAFVPLRHSISVKLPPPAQRRPSSDRDREGGARNPARRPPTGISTHRLRRRHHPLLPRDTAARQHLVRADLAKCADRAKAARSRPGPAGRGPRRIAMRSCPARKSRSRLRARHLARRPRGFARPADQSGFIGCNSQSSISCRTSTLRSARLQRAWLRRGLRASRCSPASPSRTA